MERYQESSNKRIAKNTIFLYFRMMFTMLVALYTSRVILQKLGVDDYGIYQAVGGIVGFLSFINNALATGSSRFLTYALGENNFEKLRKTFSTTLNVHIVIALFVTIIAETVGLWFLHNKMVIAPERLSAAEYVYHLSIITAAFTLTQVPYNATIIAHEKMSIYAYVSIIEVSAKLAICFLLSIGNFDKLKLYATLLLIIQIGLMIFYRIYCRNKFEESHFSMSFDRKIFKEIAGFSGWSLFASSSTALNSQGILLLLNMFFSPAVVAARAISLQVNMAANQFVTNFRTAVNPQIVKKLASKDVQSFSTKEFKNDTENSNEEVEIEEISHWMIEQGLYEGCSNFELINPTTGAVEAIIDLAWPDGIQYGLSEPIALLLNETAETQAIVSKYGYKYYTSGDELKEFIKSTYLK